MMGASNSTVIHKMPHPFPLENIKGSCWINATLQALFRSPVLQQRYMTNTVDETNTVDVCLRRIWTTKGDSGLSDLFECIRTTHMPAGQGIGDSHELMQFLCDKLPWLDEQARFQVGDILVCDHCKERAIKFDSLNEINVTPSKNMSILDAIQETCTPISIAERLCDKCTKTGCTKQLVFSTFPNMLIFHRSTLNTSMDYSSVLILNGKKYILFAVVCFNGGHWWTYGRDLPIGNAWYRLDDSVVQEITSKQFPVAGTMRMLLYFLAEK
jgi:ubiquitin C-terminal hydrolase